MTDSTPHPYEHVDKERLYEWMRQDCAALASARQSREDGLVQTITQISSAAMLAIPGFLLSFDAKIPNSWGLWTLYIGMVMFMVALFASMLEQHFSAQAYKLQEHIVQDFYRLFSSKDRDEESIKCVNKTRTFACIFFGMAVSASAIGLMSLMGIDNGKPSATTIPSSSSTPPSSTPTPSSTAISAGGRERQRDWQIGTFAGSPSTKEVVTGQNK